MRGHRRDGNCAADDRAVRSPRNRPRDEASTLEEVGFAALRKKLAYKLDVLEEDPVKALETAGYDNLIRSLGAGNAAYSYVFDAQVGTLDHSFYRDSIAEGLLDRAGALPGGWRRNPGRFPEAEASHRYRLAVGQALGQYHRRMSSRRIDCPPVGNPSGQGPGGEARRTNP